MINFWWKKVKSIPPCVLNAWSWIKWMKCMELNWSIWKYVLARISVARLFRHRHGEWWRKFMTQSQLINYMHITSSSSVCIFPIPLLSNHLKLLFMVMARRHNDFCVLGLSITFDMNLISLIKSTFTRHFFKLNARSYISYLQVNSDYTILLNQSRISYRLPSEYSIMQD